MEKASVPSLNAVERRSAALSSFIISIMGSEIEVKTIDGETWAGTLKACSSKFDIGLLFARKCPISEDYKGCIVGAVEKMEFKSKDVVEIIAPLKEVKENKSITAKKGFATDGQIADVDFSSVNNDEKKIDKEFVEWEQGDDDDQSDWQHITSLGRSSLLAGSRHKYWAPEDMMQANKNLGVVTSFKEDLSQYTTVEATGNEQDRRRADLIASQIENNAISRRNAKLENDDYERDLNKSSFPSNNRNGNDYTNANNRRGQKFLSNRSSLPQKRYERPRQTDAASESHENMRKKMEIPPRAEIAPVPASSNAKASEVRPSLTSSVTVPQKSIGEMTGLRASPASANSSNAVNHERSTSVEGHSCEHSENLEQKEAAQAKSTDGSERGESRGEVSSKSSLSFKFNPEAPPFVPTNKQELVQASLIQVAQPQVAAVLPFQSNSSSSIIPPIGQMQQTSGYFAAPSSFQPPHSLPPPNSFLTGQQMIQSPGGFVSPQQYYQQGGHPMVINQSVVSHGYPSTANQTLPTSSIASSHQMIPMVQNQLNYPLNNGSLQMVLPMHQVTYFPPVTSIHTAPPPNYMPGQPMVFNPPHGQQYLNQPQFFPQNNQ